MYLKCCHNERTTRGHNTDEKCQLIDTHQHRAVFLVVFRDKPELIIPDHHRNKAHESGRAQEKSENVTLRRNSAGVADGGKEGVHVPVANGNTIRDYNGDDGTNGEEKGNYSQSAKQISTTNHVTSSRAPRIFKMLKNKKQRVNMDGSIFFIRSRLGL